MTSLLSEKNEDKSNSIYDANTDSDGESPTNDDSIYLGLIIFGSVVFALGKMCTQLKQLKLAYFFILFLSISDFILS